MTRPLAVLLLLLLGELLTIVGFLCFVVVAQLQIPLSCSLCFALGLVLSAVRGALYDRVTAAVEDGDDSGWSR